MPRLKTLSPRLRTIDTRVSRRALPIGLTADQAYDAQRRAESPTRKLYGTRRWKALRARQLQAEPLCRMCASEGRLTPANVCDHVEPHRGDVQRFWDGPFQSLCQPHHDRQKQIEESLA